MLPISMHGLVHLLPYPWVIIPGCGRSARYILTPTAHTSSLIEWNQGCGTEFVHPFDQATRMRRSPKGLGRVLVSSYAGRAT